MKILHVVAVYPPYKGGLGHVAFEEAKHLAARGHEVHVFTLTEPGERSSASSEYGVMVHRKRPIIRYGKAGLVLGLRIFVQQGRFDLVHLHAPFFGVQEWASVFGIGSAPLVLMYHMDIVAGGFVRFVSAVSRALFLPRLLRRAKHILVSSMDYAKTSWLRPYWDCIATKVVDVAFGVDIARFRPAEHTNDRVRLLFVGGLGPNHYFKGISVLLQALVVLKGADWRLTIVGDGALRQQYEQQASDLGIGEQVSFAGRVSDEDLPGYYQSADIHVVPSIDRSEAFGLVALEAQASGVPVIASDLDGVRTVVESGKTGLLAAPNDVEGLGAALGQLIRNRELRESMGKAARKRIEERFTWKDHIDRLEDVYQSVCS